MKNCKTTSAYVRTSASGVTSGAEVSSAAIWTAYLDYCDANGEQPPLTRKEFSARVEAKGLTRGRMDDKETNGRTRPSCPQKWFFK